MNSQIFRFLKQKYSTEPFLIDRLFVSAYLKENKLIVANNTLLKSYIINDNDESETQSLEQLLALIHKGGDTLDFESLINLFEFVISPADRIVNGAIYTPAYIREYIVESLFEQYNIPVHNIKIADLSCGCGGFLFNAASTLREYGLTYQQIFENNIFGVDIQEYAINRTKILLSLLAITNGEDCDAFQFNLFTGNTLSFDWTEQIDQYEGFDMIIGNPPYVRLRNLDQHTKSLLKNWEVCNTGLTDLYIPFFQIGVENLSPHGILGYITMNSFFKSLNGRALRRYFHDRSLHLKIIDFGFDQVFKSKNTYTCICIIRNNNSTYIEYTSASKTETNQIKNFARIEYNNLDPFKGWNLKINDIISVIENTGLSLGEQCFTRHGIATLKNSVYIFKSFKSNENYYYLRVKDKMYLIEKSICRTAINPNRVKCSKNLDSYKEVLIFPYQLIDSKIIPINEENLSLYYPYAYKYLCDQKEILSKRDKGNGKYAKWYLFGRTQSLGEVEHKLFFPKIANKQPICTIVSDKDIYYYNGQAIISESVYDLQFIKKILESRLFWYYIKNTSKPYSSGYYSLNGNYIKNFGIYNFSDDEKRYIINENDRQILDKFIEDKYGVIIK